MVANYGDQPRPPILIVGAGVSGLQTARALLKRGFQVVLLEQSEDVGGVWIRNFQGYGLQVPWELYQFPEFPCPRKSELSDYPSGDAVRDYVQAYARHFDLYRHILFSCRLVSLRRKAAPTAAAVKPQQQPLTASQTTSPPFTVWGFGGRSRSVGGGDGGGGGGGGGSSSAAGSAAAGACADDPTLVPDGRCGSTTQHVQRTFMGPFSHAADDGGDGREGPAVPSVAAAAPPPPGCGRRAAASCGGCSACSGGCGGRAQAAGRGAGGCSGCGGEPGPSGSAPYDEAMCTTFSGSYSTASPLAAAAEGGGADHAEPPPPPGTPPAQAQTSPRSSAPGSHGALATAVAAAAAAGAKGARRERGERVADAAAASCRDQGGKGPAASTAAFPGEVQQGRQQPGGGQLQQGGGRRQNGCNGLLDGVWQAVYEDSSTGRQYTLDASYVVLCTGLYATPFIPSIPGQELYRGLQVHSRDFTDAGVAAGKRVLVVGAGKTAVDVVTELIAASQAAAVTLLYRRPHWPLPRFAGSVSLKSLAYTRIMTSALLPHYYTAGPAARAAAACLTPLRTAFWLRLMGRVNRALGVKRTLGTPARPICQDVWYSGRVLDAAKWPEVINNPKVQALQGEVDHFTPVSAVLQDGTELQPDIVLYATGYSNHYTFLEPAVRAALNVQHDGLYLYRHCLAPGMEGLAFVGAEVSTFNNILTAALQAEWLAAVLSGDVVLPGAQALAADVTAQQAWRRRIMPPHKLRGSSVMLYMQCYHDQLLEDMGLPTRRKKPSWRHPLSECLEPYTAMDYTDVFQRHTKAAAAASAAAAAPAQRLPTAAEPQRGVVRQKDPRVEVPGREGGAGAGAAVAACAAATAAEVRAVVNAPTALATSGPGGGGGGGAQGSPRASASVISSFLHFAAAGVGGRSSFSFRMSQARHLIGFSSTGPERAVGSAAGKPTADVPSPTAAAAAAAATAAVESPVQAPALQGSTAAATATSASPFTTAAAPSVAPAPGELPDPGRTAQRVRGGTAAAAAATGRGSAAAPAGEVDVTNGINTLGGNHAGVDTGDMDEQDTLYSLDTLPPALQAFRRTRVRVPLPAALLAPAEDFLDGAPAGSPSCLSRRRLSAVEPRTLLPPTASSAVSGCAQRAFSGAAVASSPLGRVTMPSLSSPGRGSGAVAARAPSGGGGDGGGSSANLPPPRMSSATGILGLPSGPGSLLLWAGGGSRQRSGAIGEPPPAAAAVATAAAAASAAAASEGPRTVPGSIRQGLVTELRTDSVASSSGGGNGGGGDGSPAKLHRLVRRGFSLAALLSRNRTNNLHNVSSSRMEPSSAAVSELAYKVLPPRHVEEALAAAAAAARDKRLSTGDVAALTATAPPPPPPPPPVPLQKATSRPNGAGAGAGVLRPPVPLTRPPAGPGPGPAPKPWPTAPAPPPPRQAPPARPPPLPWAPATTDTNVVSGEGMLLAFNLSPSPPMAAALPPQALIAHSAAVSSGISYMPSCSTTSFPQWPDALALAAATANGFTALYGGSQYGISSQAPSTGSPAVGTYGATETAAGVAAGAETGPNSAGAEPGPASQGVMVYAVRNDGTSAIEEAGSAGGASPGGGAAPGGSAIGGSSGGGCGGGTTWLVHDSEDRGPGTAAASSSRSSSASASSSSSDVSYMPTCSTVGPPLLMMVQ